MQKYKKYKNHLHDCVEVEVGDKRSCSHKYKYTKNTKYKNTKNTKIICTIVWRCEAEKRSCSQAALRQQSD